MEYNRRRAQFSGVVALLFGCWTAYAITNALLTKPNWKIPFAYVIPVGLFLYGYKKIWNDISAEMLYLSSDDEEFKKASNEAIANIPKLLKSLDRKGELHCIYFLFEEETGEKMYLWGSVTAFENNVFTVELLNLPPSGDPPEKPVRVPLSAIVDWKGYTENGGVYGDFLARRGYERFVRETGYCPKSVHEYRKRVVDLQSI